MTCLSMIVSIFEITVDNPTRTAAPCSFQKPLELSTSWYSIEPVKSESSVPPRKREGPLLASFMENMFSGTTLCWNAVLKKGLAPKVEMD